MSDTDLIERPDLRSANTARQEEWDAGNQITLTYRGNELAGEVGEACNIIKKLERERLGIRGSRASKQDLADELADVVICADLIAMGEGIDLLGEAVPTKFNATSEKVGLKTRYVPADRLTALEAENAELRRERDEALNRVDELEEAAEKVSEEFEGDIWRGIRNIITSYPGFDWRDYPDDMTADDITTFFHEDLNEAWKQVEASKARAEAAEAEVARLKAPLDGMQTTAEDRKLLRDWTANRPLLGDGYAALVNRSLDDLDHALAAARLAGEEEREESD